MPAQTAAQQVNVPLFRMLGSDPVYQYDFGIDLNNGADQIQKVITLEPVYNASTGGGSGLPAWVDWYLEENYNGDCLSFGYAQAGQENSFGWDAMKDGLTYQFARFAQLQSQGLLEVEPLGATGRWFKETYATTPASTITAHTAFDDDSQKSVWYCSKHYRVNLYQDENGLRIRDLHLFAENYADPFENVLCEANEATYDTLPAVDGNLFSGNGILSGLYLTDAATGNTIQPDDMIFTDLGDNKASVLFTADTDEILFLLEEDALEIHSSKEIVLHHRIGIDNQLLPNITALSDVCAEFSWRDYAYSIRLESGIFSDITHICSQDGIIRACLQTIPTE